MTSDGSHLEEAHRYSEWTAPVSHRLTSKYGGLTLTLEKIAIAFDTSLDVLRHLGMNCFVLIERLILREFFHLRERDPQSGPSCHH